MTEPAFPVLLTRAEAAACRFAVIPGACPKDLRPALRSAQVKLRAVEDTAQEESQPSPEEESMTAGSDVIGSELERKVVRALLKTRPLRAGEIARRAGLAGSDGSGRPIGTALAELVRRGLADVHGQGSRRRYTRA